MRACMCSCYGWLKRSLSACSQVGLPTRNGGLAPNVIWPEKKQRRTREGVWRGHLFVGVPQDQALDRHAGVFALRRVWHAGNERRGARNKGHRRRGAADARVAGLGALQHRRLGE